MNFRRWLAIFKIVRGVISLIAQVSDSKLDVFVIVHNPSLDTVSLYTMPDSSNQEGFVHAQKHEMTFSYRAWS